MKENPVHVKFQNQQNPKAGFDLINLEYLFQRTDIEHPPDQMHQVEFFIIIFVTEGQGYHTIDFTDYKCGKGTLLTIRKDQIHKFNISKSLKGSLLLFTDEFLVSYFEELESQKSLQLFNELLGSPKMQLSKSDFLEISDMLKRLRSEYFGASDEYSLSIIRSELHILIAKLYRIKSRKAQTISDKKYLSDFIRLQNLVESNANRTSRVQAYSKMMNVSTKTLNNITKSIVNKTAKEFIDEICIKKIKRLLINTELSVKEIAYASGFEETTNFYKYFKRQTQMTPEHFRTAY